jgi:hypothetical protein
LLILLFDSIYFFTRVRGAKNWVELPQKPSSENEIEKQGKFMREALWLDWRVLELSAKMHV